MFLIALAAMFVAADVIPNATLADGIRSAGFELAAETESNQVFAILPRPIIEALRGQFDFYIWEERADGHSVIRLVTSWATDQLQVERIRGPPAVALRHRAAPRPGEARLPALRHTIRLAVTTGGETRLG